MLDEGDAAKLVEQTRLPPRWREFSHVPQRERGMVVLAHERLVLPPLAVPAESVLWLRCMRGLPEISADGLDVEIWGRADGEPLQLLLSLHLDNVQPNASLCETMVDLPVRVGAPWQLELRCGPGPRGVGNADWLALLGLVVCAREELPLLRARTQRAWRLENEIAHFKHVYSNEFYRDRQVNRGAHGSAIGPIRQLPQAESVDATIATARTGLRARLADVPVVVGENAFGYCARLLGELVPEKAPDFVGRLRQQSAQHDGRPVRMLALCAGEASIEGWVLAKAAVPVTLCIVDVNASLLEQAALRMPPGVTVDRVLGDANDVGPQLGEFDIVVITSGLHHLVELERVLQAIAGILRPDGEFWLIGEQVGRNGNRLWPEAARVANNIFASWPEAKRLNHNTGRVDQVIPDTDFSSGCFEGIRSQDILGLLDRYFVPVERCCRDAFLWRLVDMAYAANFDLADAADRGLLMDAAVEEAMHWAQGGRGTSLHAAYRSKWAQAVALAGQVSPAQANETPLSPVPLPAQE